MWHVNSGRRLFLVSVLCKWTETQAAGRFGRFYRVLSCHFICSFFYFLRVEKMWQKCEERKPLTSKDTPAKNQCQCTVEANRATPLGEETRGAILLWPILPHYKVLSCWEQHFGQPAIQFSQVSWIELFRISNVWLQNSILRALCLFPALQLIWFKQRLSILQYSFRLGQICIIWQLYRPRPARLRQI